jgi:SAM-dependent methyltransferase
MRQATQKFKCLTSAIMKLILIVSFLVACCLMCACFTIQTSRKVAVDRVSSSELTNIPALLREVNRDIVVKLLAPPSDSSYYDAKYWEFQRPMGEMGGVLEQWKFRDYIPPGANCLDFGAGGGYLLNNLQKCAEKLGVEINPHGIVNARNSFGITLFNSTDLVPENWADVIISNHALEHALCPWCELRKLRNKLKVGTGRLIFVVPAAGRNDDWTGTPDVNNHVYTWSPKTLGNLVSSAGYVDVQVEILAHQWPDNPMAVYRDDGEESFIKQGQVKNQKDPLSGCEYQIRVVARSSAVTE